MQSPKQLSCPPLYASKEVHDLLPKSGLSHCSLKSALLGDWILPSPQKNAFGFEHALVLYLHESVHFKAPLEYPKVAQVFPLKSDLSHSSIIWLTEPSPHFGPGVFVHLLRSKVQPVLHDSVPEV